MPDLRDDDPGAGSRPARREGPAGPSVDRQYCRGQVYRRLPLYRQAGIIARDGVNIDHASLCDGVGRAKWWLAPNTDRIGHHVMVAPAIYTDDTPIGVLAPGRGKTKTGRIWTYVVDERPWAGERPPAALYHYSPDRKGERPAGHLAGYAGVIHADGYTGYEALTRSTAPPGAASAPRIVHAACWAHARRKLYDVHEATRSPIAAEGLRRIGQLYDIEREISGMAANQRLAVRQDRSGLCCKNREA